MRARNRVGKRLSYRPARLHHNSLLLCSCLHKKLDIVCSCARICKRLRNPGINSKESLPPAYVARPAGTTNRVILTYRQGTCRLEESIPWNQFLCSLKVHKFGLWTREVNIMKWRLSATYCFS
jgi:hypothetical protein